MISVDNMENPAKMRSTIRIYIIVPVFNTYEYLSKCIDSVLEEKKIELKLILIDDGSTDGSGRVCDQYANIDNRVTVIHQSNKGQIIARQKGIKYVTTQCNPKKCDIVMFLDSDDTLKKNALTEVNRIMNELSIDMMIFGMDRVSDGNIVIPYDTVGRYNGIIEKKQDLYRIVFNDWTYNPVCAKAIRISLLENDNYDEYSDVRYGEDLIQSLEYYKKSKKIFFYNKSLYNYTINPNSVTQTINARTYSVDFIVRQKVMEFLIKENVFDTKDWKQYQTFCMWLIADMLRTICLLNVSLSEKVKLIKEMRFSEYYCRYLQNRDYNRLNDWWSRFSCLLFSKQCIFIIAIVGSLYKKIRELRNKIREVLTRSDD